MRRRTTSFRAAHACIECVFTPGGRPPPSRPEFGDPTSEPEEDDEDSGDSQTRCDAEEEDGSRLGRVERDRSAEVAGAGILVTSLVDTREQSTLKLPLEPTISEDWLPDFKRDDECHFFLDVGEVSL